MTLTRDQILGAQDLQRQAVEVPEWGGAVQVRMMTGAERDAIGAALQGADKATSAAKYRLLLIATCMVGDDGRALFGIDEIEQLGAKSGRALDRVFEVAQTLNALGADAVEDAAKN